MFQYNLYSFLKERYPKTKVKADIRWFYTEDEHHGFELKRIFDKVEGSRFGLDVATASEIFSVTGQIPTLLRGNPGRFLRRLSSPVNRWLRKTGRCEACGVTWNQLEKRIEYDDLCNLDTGKNHYIFGYFIEEVYYKDRIPQIKSELKFPPMTKENAELAERMEQEESVSVHVRRGDYLSKTYSGKFLCLERDYYEKAVGIIKEHFTDPVFYIFSEDPDYVKEAFSWLENKNIVNINNGNDSYRDMELMSRCRANIIANSTFSQLAAILNDNPGHITVYPAKYMADEDTEVRTMPGWIRV